MIPALLLSVLLAGAYAALAHFLFGRTWGDIPRYWVAGCLGFALAGAVAVYFGWDWGRIGATPVLAGTVGAWAALLVAARLKI